MNDKNTDEPVTNVEQELDADRRKFLAACGRFAVVTPPAVTLLLSTSLHSDAIAHSGAAGEVEDLTNAPICLAGLIGSLTGCSRQLYRSRAVERSTLSTTRERARSMEAGSSAGRRAACARREISMSLQFERRSGNLRSQLFPECAIAPATSGTRGAIASHAGTQVSCPSAVLSRGMRVLWLALRFSEPEARRKD